MQAVNKTLEKENSIKEAEGVFDAKLKGEVDSRTEGFYTGDAYKASLEKPIPFFNSRVYAGKRQSFGSFPSYEGKAETLSDGEIFAGLSISLLRDSLIDLNRHNLWLREQDFLQAQSQLTLTKIKVQTSALKAYWTWVVSGYRLKLRKNILQLAQQRASNISKRIKAGDLAKIYQAENNQYILKRKADVLNSQLKFREASFYLSLFYRDQQGAPKMVSESHIPTNLEERLSIISSSQPVYQRAVSSNLSLKILESQRKQSDLKVRLGKNELLPKVDLNLEWNQDQGSGANRLMLDENRIMLNVEVPLQFRKGLGKKRAGEAAISRIENKKRWVKEKLRVSVESFIIKLNTLSEIFTATKTQVKLADKLAKAERRKFTQGASDLILVNLREENFAEAKLKNLSTYLKYMFVDAEIKDLEVRFLSE